jgi:hypothetical protein
LLLLYWRRAMQCRWAVTSRQLWHLYRCNRSTSTFNKMTSRLMLPTSEQRDDLRSGALVKKQKFRPVTGPEGPDGDRGIAVFFLWPRRQIRCGQRLPWSLYPPKRDLVTVVLEAGSSSGPVWTSVENLISAGIRSPDCPARSESLSRPRGCQFYCLNNTGMCMDTINWKIWLAETTWDT